MTTEEELRLILEHYKAAQEAGKEMLKRMDTVLFYITDILQRLGKDKAGRTDESERIPRENSGTE
jgi:hypothetical protein